MAISIVPYMEEHVPAVRDFNSRLAAGGAPDYQQLPETPDAEWMPGMRQYLATEGSMVRGGYILRHHVFYTSLKTMVAAHYRLPVSEGVVDRAYANLGLRLVRDALVRQPYLYSSGMGRWTNPLPAMLKRLKWSMCEVPFHFKIIHPAQFLRNISVLRTSAVRRFVLDVAAASGAGWVGLAALGIMRRLPPQTWEMMPDFAGWADDVWQRSRDSYALLGVRDAATLDELYPPGDPRFLRVSAAGGWAVALDTQMKDHKQFGDMRVGSIVDCLAPPNAAKKVMWAVTAMLEERGVDLIVSNQLHTAWSRALLDSEFRRGPSNYLLALSPEFAAAVGKPSQDHIHFNRGDGDGPIHL